MKVQEIDTPALLVDLDAMEANLKRWRSILLAADARHAPTSRITRRRRWP